MIFSEARVSGPYGAIEAKSLKPGDPVWSWDGNKWRSNSIWKVQYSKSKTSHALFCFATPLPMYLRCTGNQLFRIKGAKNVKGSEVRAGQAILVSEGAHVFRAEVGAVETTLLSEPEDTFAFELRHGPKNILVDGFLCKATNG